MSSISFDTFKQESLGAGFDEVLERQWAADTFLDTHTPLCCAGSRDTRGNVVELRRVHQTFDARRYI